MEEMEYYDKCACDETECVCEYRVVFEPDPEFEDMLNEE